MKIDYKPKALEMGSLQSPAFKRILHVGLGFSAFVCLIVALSIGNSPTPTQTVLNQATETSPVPVLPAIKLVMSTSDTAKETKELKKAADPVPAVVTAKEVRTPTDIRHKVIVRTGDTLSRIFTRLGVSTRDLQEIMNTDTASQQLASLQPGQTLTLRTKEKQLDQLVLELGPGDTIQVSRQAEGFLVSHKVQPLEKQLAFGKGSIRDSLFSAAKRAGLDTQVTTQMVQIFGRTIDFALDLQPEDTFRVLYEEKYLGDKLVETGHILAAEIVTKDKKHQAVRYTDKSGRTSYFSPDGYGLQQGFLRTPVNFTRISSQFGMRKHPVLHKLRQHKGTDYSAPTGTPVHTIGDGKVAFMGRRGGYGKMIEITHGSRYVTRYAHLSRFPKGLKAGKAVSQGETIGFVGKTGLATGPHLHFEFLVDGIHCNPLTVALPKSNPISAQNKRHFIAHAKEMLRLLDAHDHKLMASNEYPLNE